MVTGSNIRSYLSDLKYNTNPAVLAEIQDSLARIQNAARKAGKEQDWDTYHKYQGLVDLTSGNSLANVYNTMKEGKVDRNSVTNDEGKRKPVEHIELLDAHARMLAKEDLSPFEKMSKSLKMITSELPEPSEEDKEDQEEEMQARCTQTCSDEDEFGQEEREPENLTNSKFGELYNWLKSIEQADSKVKKLKQMEKMSDLQKVSSIEFAKPKGLFMKKLINKEFWFRGSVPAERFLNVITDNSGSMGTYKKYRNEVFKMVFDTAQRLSMNLEHTFFNTRIHDQVDQIKSKVDLDNLMKKRPDGDDNLGASTIGKLKKLKKTKEKQYLLAISDGTGSFEDAAQSDLAMMLAKEKNVELRFALFSSQNDMRSIPAEMIFQIYNGNAASTGKIAEAGHKKTATTEEEIKEFEKLLDAQKKLTSSRTAHI